MPGHGGADGDVGRLDVANFADHYDIRILPQNMAKTFGKSEIDFRLHIDLGNSRQAIFHRLFDGNDAALDRVNAGKKTIKGCRFSAAGWAGQQDDSVRLREQLANDLLLFFAQVEPLETEPLVSATE